MPDRDGALLIFQTSAGPERHQLRGDAALIGRDPKADLRLDDRSLSARHCRLEPAGGGAWKVVDLESRNGTYVNGRAVQQRRLADGDRLRLGRVELVYRASQAAEDLLDSVGRLAGRIHDRLGEPGLRQAAERFAAEAARHGLPDMLAGSPEVHAAQLLQTVMRALVDDRRPQRVFELLLDSLIEFTGAERGFFLMHPDPPKGRKRSAEIEPTIVAARNMGREDVQEAARRISYTIERQARLKGEPVLVTDADVDERFTGSDSIADLQLRSILAVPVPGAGGASSPAGTIVLDHRFERGLFLERQLPLIGFFADQAAVALRSAALHAENDRRLSELTAAKSEVEELNRILTDRVAQTSAELMEVREQVLRERDEAPLKYSYANIVAASRPMREVFRLLDKVTDSDVPVLIHGESGTGKELVARALHFNGARKNGPFVSENCAAIPETLLESELFGYTKGSFTGATADRKGLFEAANGGTLLLDEIGDMPLDMQKKLLRALQEGEIRRIGGRQSIPLDVRIVAASNQDLRSLCDQGRFREDLFYRLNVIAVTLPPLRDRREDIPLLVEHFLEEAARKGSPRTVSEEAMKALCAYGWPGNVRELRNEVQRAAALSDKVIVPLILSPAVRGAATELGDAPVEDLGERSLKEMVKEVTEALESRVIRAALAKCEGRKARAARLLGISRPTLDAKIELYGLSVHRT
ncbi:MAG: sigma 54-interacting transcriptional regulator [Planctomycetes bacterium]|nr:sigma 54-interacting transcriptional regulator [Planctomycetota bacterium]MCB9825153.1 sigma 54-interacting transcriptional regulator [Planctomycetota bacterium]MCB9829382.1 sigma 54-interacting transcriptional regulator [Planctomycetota bacterium]MCB9901975.1 sigma 54-interacting transcriptional regulator [Planctomycetota bacterium]